MEEEKKDKNASNKEVKKEKDKKKKNLEVEKLKEENATLNDKILRISAEMQNMKKRYEDEISRIYKYEGEAFIKKTLDVLDNFERAVSLDDENLDDELSKFLSGFKLIYNNLKNNLNEIGVVEIECIDTPFDPNSMEAVMTEKKDGVDANIVTAIMRKGYKYNDKIIRPAMVKVSE